MQTEILQQAVQQSLCAKKIRRFHQALKNLVEEFVLEGSFLFDGKDIMVVLNDIQARANNVQEEQVRASSRSRVETVDIEEKAEEGSRESESGRLRAQGSRANARLRAQEDLRASSQQAQSSPIPRKPRNRVPRVPGVPRLLLTRREGPRVHVHKLHLRWSSCLNWGEGIWKERILVT